MVDPPEDIPSGEEFLRKLPERARQAEETAFIIDIFQPRRSGTPTFGRGLRKRGGTSKGDRQDDINDGYKWCGATPSPVERSRGILKST